MGIMRWSLYEQLKEEYGAENTVMASRKIRYSLSITWKAGRRAEILRAT